MFVKNLPYLFLAFYAFSGVKTQSFTFKNVIVTCEPSKKAAEEEDFAITVTGNNLQPHLYPGLDCFTLEIKHSIVPILYDGALSDIKDVNILLLEDNEIEQIHPGAFTNTNIREGMSLKSNRLTEVKKGVFNDLQVPILRLSHNQISIIHPEAFDNMTSLEHVFLDNNRLASIDSRWFKNTPRLNRLDFRKNLIQVLPPFAFGNVLKDKYFSVEIDLSRNLIRTIDRNALKTPPRVARFHFLNLAHNQIQNLDASWLIGVQIRHLDLSNNKIQCLINSAALAGAHSTNYLDGNSWLCDCLARINTEVKRLNGQIIADETFRKCRIID